MPANVDHNNDNMPYPFFGVCKECNWVGLNYATASIPADQVNAHNNSAHPIREADQPVFRSNVLFDVNSLHPSPFYKLNLDALNENREFTIQPRRAGKNSWLYKQAINSIEQLKEENELLTNANMELRTQLKIYKSANYGKPAIDGLRIKDALIKQLEQDIEARKAEATQKDILNDELVDTIRELMEAKTGIPECKTGETIHNFQPLEVDFVFCTKCGHSVHYKSAGE